MIETHPFGNFVPPDATCLILGSFPTHPKNWRFNSFYPGRANFFWRMMADIYGRKFTHTTGHLAAVERLALCSQKGIGLSDTILSCRRLVPESSKDSDLEVVEKMDVLNILTQNLSINTIILTGSSGDVSAHKLFFEHLADFNIPFIVGNTKAPIHGSFTFNGRNFQTHTLYSTSGLNIGRYQQALEQYRACLPK